MTGVGEVRATTRTELLIGLLIVAVSIVGAGVTWRAAGASGTAADLDQRARQARIHEAQLRAENAAVVAFERRLFTSYREHHALADALAAEGERLRAREERAAARSLEPLFYAAGPYDEKGRRRKEYDREAARSFVEEDGRLAELRPDELERAAVTGRSKRFQLVLVDVMLIGSIFFSTVALLIPRVRRWVAATGLALAVGGVVLLVVVELIVKVPAP